MKLHQVEDELLRLLNSLASEVLEIQKHSLNVREKSDQSPVTMADELVSDRLRQLFRRFSPGLAIVDEESTMNPQALDEGIVIDPLDGTKEFIAGKKEFTFNVAYVSGGRPEWGIVTAPAHGETFLGDSFNGFRHLGAKSTKQPRLKLGVVMSGSHSGQAEGRFLQALKSLGETPNSFSYGSSLKICRLADGSADIYPRFGPTMEWDTAAAQAVLNASGGLMVDLVTGEEMKYGKPEFRNNGFLALNSSWKSRRSELLQICRSVGFNAKEVSNA